MEKTNGLHLYVDVLNMEEIIRGEEEANDELKRSIHRLHTYYTGLTKAVKHFGGDIEKFTVGRAHIFIEQLEEEDDETFYMRVLDLVVACFSYCYDVFNEIGKYSQYTKFKLRAGLDCGEFYKYEITAMDEFTTIGGVANIAAKLTGYAGNKKIYLTYDARQKLPKEERDKFGLLDSDELAEIQARLKGNPVIYSAEYTSLSKSDKVIKLMETLEEECDEVANQINLSEMKFEDSRSKIDFGRLSRTKNKQIEAGIFYADIRGFTKLFNVSGNNLDNLSVVLEKIYEEMNEATNGQDGVRVQFQGDRIVAVFNTFNGEEKFDVVRMFEAALILKDKIAEVNTLYNGYLGGKEVKIGIGLCHGEYYATRLGRRNYMDNIVLGSTANKGSIAEDRYADDGEIAVAKGFKERIYSLKDDSLECQVIADCLSAINSTGYYKTSIDYQDYLAKIEEQKQENEKAKLLSIGILKATGTEALYGKERNIRPYGKPV